MNVAAGAHPAPRARTRVMAAIAGGILILFIILLLIGVVARIRTDRELKTAAQSVQTAVQQLLGLALTLGDRLARPIDVGASAIVIPVEENDARPDIDRLFVVFREVMIEAGDEKFFDARRALGIGVRFIGVGALWLRQRHRLWGKTPDPSMN